MMFRVVSSLMMEAVRTSETSVDNNFTRQYIPEDNSEHLEVCHRHFWKPNEGTGACHNCGTDDQ
jgi:hypothetical protein